MGSDGLSSEISAEIRALSAQSSHIPFERDTLHALIDYYCNPSREFRTPRDTQVLVGLCFLHKDKGLDPS